MDGRAHTNEPVSQSALMFSRLRGEPSLQVISGLLAWSGFGLKMFVSRAIISIFRV